MVEHGDVPMENKISIDPNTKSGAEGLGEKARHDVALSYQTPGNVESDTAAFLASCPEMTVLRDTDAVYPGHKE